MEIKGLGAFFFPVFKKHLVILCHNFHNEPKVSESGSVWRTVLLQQPTAAESELNQVTQHCFMKSVII